MGSRSCQSALHWPLSAMLSPPQFELCAGSGPFWRRAKADMAAARCRLCVQAMTFEGDEAGSAVAEAIIASPAADRRVLADDYSRHVINDRLLAWTRNKAVHAEARATSAMFGRIVAGGAALRLTNPYGWHPLSSALRNHKKLVLADDVVWIGGINFSDHNFAWHDLMLRIESREVADWMAAQFDQDWRGEPVDAEAQFGGLTLINVNGTANAAGLEPLMQLFRGARRSIRVISPYPTFPFLDAMGEAAQRGARVTLCTPAGNNKPLVRDYLFARAPQLGIAVQLMPGMTHAKAALIDDDVLVLGSCNFDFVSYRTNGEYVALIRDAALIEQFRRVLLDPAERDAVPLGPGHSTLWGRLKGRIALRCADIAVSTLRHGKRIAEWPLAGS